MLVDETATNEYAVEKPTQKGEIVLNQRMRSTASNGADHGPNPYVTNISRETLSNPNYRKTIWTGEHLQSTVMSIPPGGEIGLEVHLDTDQFLRVESGFGVAMMGPTQNNLNYRQPVRNDVAIFVPAGTWHNVVNTGRIPLKLYSIYAPPHHPHGTVQKTKAQADAEE